MPRCETSDSKAARLKSWTSSGSTPACTPAERCGKRAWNVFLCRPFFQGWSKNSGWVEKRTPAFIGTRHCEGNAISDPELLPIIEGYRDDESIDLSPTEICHQILAAVTREASLILADEIVTDPHDVDLCIIHGFSFPDHQGGILILGRSVRDREHRQDTGNDFKTRTKTESTGSFANNGSSRASRFTGRPSTVWQLKIQARSASE